MLNYVTYTKDMHRKYSKLVCQSRSVICSRYIVNVMSYLAIMDENATFVLCFINFLTMCAVICVNKFLYTLHLYMLMKYRFSVV